MLRHLRRIVAPATSLTTSFWYFEHHWRREAEAKKRREGAWLAAPVGPTFTAEEVAEHDGKGGRGVWVTYEGHVYDITDFMHEHPGGSIILQAAGGPIEPYWGYWAYHALVDTPRQFLAKYKIGSLVDDVDDDVNGDVDGDVDGDGNSSEPGLEDYIRAHYSEEPQRGSDSGQLRLTTTPYMSETDPGTLAATYLTPNEGFYVRNHGPVPVIDDDSRDSFEIQIQSPRSASNGTQNNTETTKITLKDLANPSQPPARVVSVLQCAGNRAGEMLQRHHEAGGTTRWNNLFEIIGGGMIGNAEWGGVWLGDVLRSAVPGIHGLQSTASEKDQENDEYHVVFEGIDGYAASTPLNRVLDRKYKAMLATTMNGKPLPPDHGYPVRALLPGIAGARSVKWVKSIRIEKKESDSPWHKHYYRKTNGSSIQPMPLTSLILSHRLETHSKQTSAPDIRSPDIESATIALSGIAWGGGEGKGVSKVEVTGDGGKTWDAARLLRAPPPRLSRDDHDDHDVDDHPWGWVQWEASLPLVSASHRGQYEVYCRAFDGEGQSQHRDVWNPRGYQYNGWNRIRGSTSVIQQHVEKTTDN